VWTLFKLVGLLILGGAAVYGLVVAFNPWALHIGGQSTPLLYWTGMGTLTAKGGKAYPLYVYFYPGRPQGIHGGGRRDGKVVSAHLQGTAELCTAPGKPQL
jgi:hypothetical protein